LAEKKGEKKKRGRKGVDVSSPPSFSGGERKREGGKKREAARGRGPLASGRKKEGERGEPSRFLAPLFSSSRGKREKRREKKKKVKFFPPYLPLAGERKGKEKKEKEGEGAARKRRNLTHSPHLSWLPRGGRGGEKKGREKLGPRTFEKYMQSQEHKKGKEERRQSRFLPHQCAVFKRTKKRRKEREGGEGGKASVLFGGINVGSDGGSSCRGEKKKKKTGQRKVCSQVGASPAGKGKRKTDGSTGLTITTEAASLVRDCRQWGKKRKERKGGEAAERRGVPAYHP